MSERWLRLTVVAVLATALGCEEERPPSGLDVDAGPPCEVPDLPSVPGDVDGDGTPNDEDDDADGDGLSNGLEHAGGLGCAGSDVDEDGTDNWLDPDSDGDGIPDANEVEHETDPYAADSDGDGATDLVEAAAGTSALNELDVPREHEVVVLEPGSEQSMTLDFVNRIENADVFLLLDTTGSMGGEKDNLTMGLDTVIVPGIEEVVPNVEFGFGGMEDYPVGDYGGTSDLPFYLVSEMTKADEDRGTWNGERIAGSPNGMADLSEALQGLQIGNGEDLPEAFVPALWVTATGEELPWPGGAVRAQTRCPTGARGYPCFRPEALPIIILIGDAAFHNGPGDTEAYTFTDSTIEPPTYEEAVTALRALGAKVITVYSGGGDDLGDYRTVSMDTGAVGTDGSPMTFEISDDGSGLGSSVVTAVGQLAEGRTQDIQGRPGLVGSWPPGGALDDVLLSFVTGEADVYESKDDTTFFQLERESAFSFEATFGAADPPAVGAAAHMVQIAAVDEDGATFAARRVLVVSAPAGTTLVLP